MMDEPRRYIGHIHYFPIKFDGRGPDWNRSPEIYQSLAQMEMFIPMFFRVRNLRRYEPFDEIYPQWLADDEFDRLVGFTFQYTTKPE